MHGHIYIVHRVHDTSLLRVRGVFINPQVVRRSIVPFVAKHRVRYGFQAFTLVIDVSLDGRAPRFREIWEMRLQVTARDSGAIGSVNDDGGSALIIHEIRTGRVCICGASKSEKNIVSCSAPSPQNIWQSGRRNVVPW
jgi:hypothetical protein